MPLSPHLQCRYSDDNIYFIQLKTLIEKIYAVRHLVLSQSTRVTDGQTDRITTPKTALAYARAVKKTHTNELEIRE